MTREEKCKLAIEKGYWCEPYNGFVYNKNGIRVGHNNKNYIRFSVQIGNNKKIDLMAHQFIWYWVYKECVECLDHINRIRHDNRIINLRSVLNQQNHFNRNNIKGCRFKKENNNWNARIKIHGKEINLGVFNSEKEAHKAYLEAKEKLHKMQINITKDEMINYIKNLKLNKLKDLQGYVFHKPTNSFQVRISVNGKIKSFGYYKTEEEAKKVYIENKSKLIKENENTKM